MLLMVFRGILRVLGVGLSLVLLTYLLIFYYWGLPWQWRTPTPPTTPPLTLTPLGTPSPDPAPPSVPWPERLAIREPTPWTLYKHLSGTQGLPYVGTVAPSGLRSDVYPDPRKYATADACEEARAARVAGLHQQIAAQAPGRVHLQRIDGGSKLTWPPAHWRDETWLCVRDDEPPS